MMSDDSDKSISSQESEAGPTPSVSQNGQTTFPFGQAPAPAPRSRKREKRKLVLRAKAETLCRILTERGISCAVNVNTNGSPMVVTSGPSSDASLKAAAQNTSLENKLRERMDSYGSPEYTLRWKNSDMMYGGPIFRLRAWARRTSGSGCGGWPTPKAQEDGRTLEQYEKGRLRGYEKRKGKTCGGPSSKQGGLAIAVQLVGWQTPSVEDATRQGSLEDYRKYIQEKQTSGCRLRAQVHSAGLTGWPSPRAADSEGGMEPPGKTGRKLGAIAGWATPTQADAHKIKPFHEAPQPALAYQCHLAGWATPAANWRDPRSRQHGKNARPLNEQAGISLRPGETMSLSRVQTEKRGVLNPAHSRWLLGYPAAWDKSSPGWKKWALWQRLLRLLQERNATASGA